MSVYRALSLSFALLLSIGLGVLAAGCGENPPCEASALDGMTLVDDSPIEYEGTPCDPFSLRLYRASGSGQWTIDASANFGRFNILSTCEINAGSDGCVGTGTTFTCGDERIGADVVIGSISSDGSTVRHLDVAFRNHSDELVCTNIRSAPLVTQ